MRDEVTGNTILSPRMSNESTTLRRDNRRRGTRWCFTINNYQQCDEERLRTLAAHAKYIIYGREKAPGTGTAHLQGFVNLRKRCEFSKVRKKPNLLSPHQPNKSTRSKIIYR